jgi:hypothetical protein
MEPYNLFRSKQPESLICAVPESRAVPPFVTGERWTYAGRLDTSRAPPLGFDREAAWAGVRFNGFYLFPDFAGKGPSRR